MPLTDIESLPSNARLWVFGSDRSFSPADRERLEAQLGYFVDGWTAHRVDLTAAYTLYEDRFVLVALDESAVAASGCSIDGLLQKLAELERGLDVRLLDGRLVWYRDVSGEIVSCDRGEFQRLARDGGVDARTRVFDLTIERLGDWRSGRLERAAAESWHGRLLPSSRPGACPGPTGQGADASS